MTTQSFEVPIVATVVGGHLKVGDDFQGGVKSLIRLRPDYPLDTLQGIEGVVASPGHLVLLRGLAQRRRAACPQPSQQP